MIAVDTTVLIYAHRLETSCKFCTWVRHPITGRRIEEWPHPRRHLVIPLSVSRTGLIRALRMSSCGISCRSERRLEESAMRWRGYKDQRQRRWILD